MTIAQLIEKLSEYNPDAEISVTVPSSISRSNKFEDRSFRICFSGIKDDQNQFIKNQCTHVGLLIG